MNLTAISEKDVDLRSGEHMYVFDIALKENLPPSLLKNYCKIDYFLEVKVNSKKSKIYQIQVHPVRVERSIDIINYPSLQKEYNDERLLADGIKLLVSLPRTIFSVGDIIPLAVQLLGIDQQKVEIYEVRVIFQTNARLTSDPPFKKIKEFQEEILVCSSQLLENFNNQKIHALFKVPNMENHEVMTIRCISLNYEIAVKIKYRRNIRKHEKKEFIVKIPIFLGKNVSSSNRQPINEMRNCSLEDRTCMPPPPSYDDVIASSGGIRL